jgi:hypothetical protein
VDYKQAVKELTMMLLYLTSWREKDFYECQRSWKGYDFDILDELADEGLISDSKRSKSVVLYDDGISMAKEFLRKYKLDLNMKP